MVTYLAYCFSNKTTKINTKHCNLLSIGGPRMLCLLFGKNFRAIRYSFLCVKEKRSTSHFPAFISSHRYFYYLQNNYLSNINYALFLVMPMISWGATKYFPGGHGTFIGRIL